MSFRERFVDCCCTERARFITVVTCSIAAIAFILTNLAIATTKETAALSWTKFSTTVPFTCTYGGQVNVTTGSADVNMGLLTYRLCGYPSTPFAHCLNEEICVTDSDDVSGFDTCYKAGQSVIASYSFGLFFGALVVLLMFLHKYKVCRVRFPRIIIFIAGTISLALYIQPLVYWYAQCQNNLSGGSVEWTAAGNTYGPYGISSVAPGYAIALAILCVVLSFVALILNIVRCFRGGYDDDTPSSGVVMSHNRSSSQSQFSSPTSPEAPGYFPTSP